MNWLRRMIHALVGRDRYHDQANEVNDRQARLYMLSKRLEVIQRGKR